MYPDRVMRYFIKATALLGAIHLLAACGPSVPTSTPEPLSVENVRDRILDSLQRDGFVTRYEVQVLDAPGIPRGEPSVGWMDIANARSRHEVLQGSFSIALIADGGSGVLRSSGNNVTLREDRELPAGAFAEPWRHIPRPLNVPLERGEAWARADETDWYGETVTAWSTTHEQIAQFAEWLAEETIFLDQATELPVGQRTILRSLETGEITRELGVTFVFEFEPEDSIEDRFFELESLRQETLGYGRFAGQGPDHDVYWFGDRIPSRGGSPELQLRSTRVVETHAESHVEFIYDNPGPVPLGIPPGSVEVLVGTPKWWHYHLIGAHPHWSENSERIAVEIDGIHAEFAVGDDDGSEAVVWLPGAVVFVSAQRVSSQGFPANSIYASNAYDSAEAIMSLISVLEAVR